MRWDVLIKVIQYLANPWIRDDINHTITKLGTANLYFDWICSIQSNNPAGRLGEARQSGNSAVTAELTVWFKWASIFWITAGSSMLAMMRTSPPHSLQVSMSILKTRFKRFAQVIEARFSAGVWSTSLAGWRFLSLPRPAGVTFERYLLLGANTPWKRVFDIPQGTLSWCCASIHLVDIA
jgi:hypothetical protein